MCPWAKIKCPNIILSPIAFPQNHASAGFGAAVEFQNLVAVTFHGRAALGHDVVKLGCCIAFCGRVKCCGHGVYSDIS